MPRILTSLWIVMTITAAEAFIVPTTTTHHSYHRISQQQQQMSSSSYVDYLSSLSSSNSITSNSFQQSGSGSTSHTVVVTDKHSHTDFAHAPLSYFALDQLTPKGPRAHADVGQPHDATRQLYYDDTTTIATGSWWCASGGWPSPKQRTTTEIFYVLEGHGCLTDLDSTRHYFGPGDTVILPKGWSGRWDVLEDIHKVWFVHEHPRIEEKSNPIRARIVPYSMASPQYMVHKGVRADATHGSPSTASHVIYDVGPTEAGFWTCTPGSFPVQSRSTTECFHVLEGVFFLTNADGSARRCQAGDTVVLPKGWSGYWDVLETVKKLWVVV